MSAAPAPFILLVEDNTMLGEVLEIRIAALGYRVAWAKTGTEALEAALATPPDLILSDLWLPELDGFGLIEALKARGAMNAPVIIMTASRYEGEARKALSLGAVAALGKPFEFARLQALLDEHLPRTAA